MQLTEKDLLLKVLFSPILNVEAVRLSLLSLRKLICLLFELIPPYPATANMLKMLFLIKIWNVLSNLC